MKKMIKKLGMLSVMASLAMTQAFAGVVEHELEAGDSAVSEFVFVAKTDKTAIIRIAQSGISESLRDGVIDVAPDNVYGFAFGQPNVGIDPNPWENYVIDTVGAQASGGLGLQGAICGDATANAADLEQIYQATQLAETFTPDVAAGPGLDLTGSCVVSASASGDTVAADVKVGYEVLVSGGATMDLQVDLLNGVESDLQTANTDMEFASFTLSQENKDAAGIATASDLTDPLGTILGHGDHGVLTFSIAFEATGPSAKPERRASAVLVAAVPL